jgi:DNA-directed RNA polymerase subunit L
MEEIEWKALEVDESLIRYDDPNREPDIILAEFCKRIGLIPVSQKISDDAKFSLHVANAEGRHGHGHSKDRNREQEPDVEYKIVYAGDLKQIGGAKAQGLFDTKYRLAALSPGKVIEVTGIKVVRGYGYTDAKFNTCSFEYKTLDYFDVYYLSAKDQINSHMTALADVRAAMPKGSGSEVTAKSRVLVIPDKSYLSFASDRTKEKIKSNYDIVIENSNIQPASSSTNTPKHFSLSFRFFCDVDPKEILVYSLQTLKDRLSKIRKVLQDFDGGSGSGSTDEVGFMEISMPDAMVGTIAGLVEDKRIPSILIRGEDHVIGNLIVKTVLRLDPKTPMINYKIIHPSNRSVVINIMHQQPIKIVTDAVGECYNTFDALQKQVTG